NHCEEEDQEGNNSSEIETLTYHVLATYSGSGGFGMMSQKMMRTTARMRRMRTIVRGCGVNIDLYLAVIRSFVTSSPVL
nr:hypothetical protein [Tanacetum cinerariifolium]